MHGSLLVEVPPGPYLPERRYAIGVVLGEFLGLAFRLAVADVPHVRITREDEPEGAALTMSDGLFATPFAEWLRPESLPATPLAWWCTPGWISEGHEISGRLPVIFGRPTHDTYVRESDGQTHLGLDVFGSAFFMLTRYEELVKPVRDRYGRYPATASLAYHEGFLERPIVNEYVEVLWRAMRRLWPGLQRKPRQFRLSLSHDVDLPFFTCPKQLLRVGWQDLAHRRDPAAAMGRVGSFWDARRGRVASDPVNTFDLIMRHSEALGVQSAFYFIADHTGGLIDGTYQLTDPPIQALIKEIHARGHELGLHPSYHTYRDRPQLAHEHQALMAAMEAAGVEQDTWGGRQHYLRWENPVTWRHWEAIGMDYDASLAYADRVGFRCGTCDEFPAYDLVERRQLALIERPLTVMDITLTVYMGLPLPLAVEKLLAVGRLCRMFRGTFALLWHNSSLMFDEQKRWYASALTELTAPGAWVGGHKAS
ncbi:MAG: polysaccharide deacetylase family protein [Candidatus Sericytochromatia bacterium]